MLGLGLGSSKLEKIKKKHLKWFLLLGLIEPFSYFLCEVFGLSMISATLAAVILSTIPLFSPLFSCLFIRERITVSNIIGLLVSLIGVCLILLDGKGNFAFKPLGLLLLFGAVIVAITYSLFVRRMSRHYSEITIVTSQNIIGVFLFLPLFFIVDYNHLGELSISSHSIIAVIVLGIFASALAFVFYAYSLKHNGIVRTNAYLNLLPAMTAFLAYMVLGDSLSFQKIIGVIVVIIGLFINQIPSKPQD